MNLNISMLKDYLSCPQKAFNLHVLRRGPAKVPVVLEVGTLFHEAMERRLRGEKVGFIYEVAGGPPRAIASELPYELPSWGGVSEDAQNTWMKHKLWLPANAFTPEWVIAEIEAPLSAAIGTSDDILQGRLDAVVHWNGKYWSLQWKTYDDDLLGLQERVRLSYHEVAYQYLAEKTGYKPWGGTILGACQKLPGYRITAGKRQEITDEQRIAALSFHYLTRPPETQAQMWEQTERHLVRAAASLDCGHVERDYDSCFGPFGKGRCPFFTVCHEKGSLDGPEFIDLKDRYAEV